MKFARRSGMGVVVLGCATLAWAHSHLQKSVPADGAVLPQAPHEFRLTFAEPVKLTALSLQKNEEGARKLPLPGATAEREFVLPAPALESGHYQLQWRVLSDDGHVMPGQLRFTIAAQGH